MKPAKLTIREVFGRRLKCVVGYVVLAVASLSWATINSHSAFAEDVSAPAMLQIQDRQVDLFYTGYGAMWLPPPGRADSGDQSVGYDVFDRSDLGRARKETLYGTETSLKLLVGTAHAANVNIYTDLILNHAGFSDLSTFDDYGTPGDPNDDVTFADQRRGSSW